MSEGKLFGTITISNLTESEAYEVSMALVHRHNEAYRRLHSNYNYKMGGCKKEHDELTVKLCPPIIDALQNLIYCGWCKR